MQYFLSGYKPDLLFGLARSMNEQERQLTHRYTAEFNGARLRIRMHTTGGFASYPPMEFSAQRAPEPAAP